MNFPPRSAPLRWVILVTAALAAGCEKRDGDVRWWQGEQERHGLSQQLALREYRFEKLGAKDLTELDRLRQTNKELSASRKMLEQRRQALSGELDGLKDQLAGFREATLRDQRNRAIGRTFDAFVSLTGRTYQEVTVAAIDDAGVTIRHADGSARLRFDDLDSSQRLLFGLDSELALAALARESEEVAEYERWIDSQMLVVREKESLAAAESARRDERAAEADRAKLAARQSLASNQRPLAQPASTFGSGRSGYYSTYRAYRPVYRYVYHVPTYPTYGYSNYGNPKSCITYKRPPVTRHVTPIQGGKPKSFANTTLPSIP